MYDDINAKIRHERKIDINFKFLLMKTTAKVIRKDKMISGCAEKIAKYSFQIMPNVSGANSPVKNFLSKARPNWKDWGVWPTGKNLLSRKYSAKENPKETNKWKALMVFCFSTFQFKIEKIIK